MFTGGAATTNFIRIDVYDVQRKEWRHFDIVPPDVAYIVKCGNGLHQFHPRANACACRQIER